MRAHDHARPDDTRHGAREGWRRGNVRAIGQVSEDDQDRIRKDLAKTVNVTLAVGVA
jgi:hypothetical protein